MARDFFHNNVRIALESDGWKITHDPYQLSVLGVDYDIDLGAEKIIAAEKGLEQIAIEVKSFMGFSFPYEFHQAIGQYTDYGILLRHSDPDRVLFLAVPKSIYEKKFSIPAFQLILSEARIKLIVFDSEEQKIVKWIK
jgi:hypothetical protein